jgi:exoribonuclease R
MTSKYHVAISDREYTSWNFIHKETGEPKTLAESESLINPAILKLFEGDLVDLSTPIPTVLESPTKTDRIAGILILEGGQTYGRTSNQKRLLYKCLPNNPKLPAFLVPYQPDVNFSKTQKNRYVVFRFDNWSKKHPQGILAENLGEVDNFAAFCEYQLYCRDIHNNLSEFTQSAKRAIASLPDPKDTNARFFVKTFPESSAHSAFTIDPRGTTDFDDAFSLHRESSRKVTVRVYISNVYVWMETMNLWKYVNRVSTVYLPESKRSMLPSVLSDSLCSLVADGKDRIAFCMELKIDLEQALVVPSSIRFYNQAVKIVQNYVYESADLCANTDYQLLHRCTKILDPEVDDSHDVVAFWMIQMNQICGDLMQTKRTGIFREVTSLDPEPDAPVNLPFSTKRLVNNWKNVSASYCLATTKKDPYVHITSPIRRIVDLLNQTIFQLEFGMISSISEDAREFIGKWINQIGRINKDARSVRKAQIDCDMLYRCTAHPEWMQQSHRGVIFDRFEKSDGNYSYMVHLSDLNILARITTQEKYVNYEILEFRIFVFEDADKIHRKILLGVFHSS